MKLINPTDDELNAAFAVHVCGASETRKESEWCDTEMRLPDVKCGTKMFESWKRVPSFTDSADAVLPWLEKCATFHHKWNAETKLHTVHCSDRIYPYYMDESFSRAAVIALLRAHNVEVEFTHE